MLKWGCSKYSVDEAINYPYDVLVSMTPELIVVAM